MARRKGPDIASAIAEALGNSDYVSSLLGAAKIADELDGKSIKMKVSIDGAEQVEEVTSNIDGLLSSLKELSNYKSRTKFFQSIENATEEVKKSWNDLIKLINSTDIDKSKGLEGLFENDKIKKAALDVYKYSNALTALGGDTSKVSKQISELVEQISRLQNKEGKNTYTASAGYLYDVDSFRQVFDLLKKLQSFGTDFIDGDIFEQLGLKVGNFKPVENAIQNLLDISLQYDYVQKQTANTVSSSYDQQTSSIENTTRAIERLTREQVKLEALSKHKYGRIYDDSDVDYYFDYNTSKIQRYSEALDELKYKQQNALNGAVYYQNLFADTNGSDSEYFDEMNQSMQDYAKYTAQVEYIQEQLNEAVKNYNPSQITGGDATEQWIVLITLIKEAAEKIKALNDAIGDVGSDESFKPLLASIEDIKNAFAGVVEEIRNLQSALSNITIEQSTNFNIDNSGKGAKAELQLEEYLNKTVQRYENEYRKFFSDKRLSSDLLFASLASSKTLMQRTGERNVTQDYFEDLYGQATITKIQDPKTKIMRIIDFLEAIDVVLKDNADAIGESWDALKAINKTVHSTRTKGSFTSSLNKKIRDFQKEETEDAKSAIDEALNGDDLMDEQASLAKVASLLEQINNLLNDIADNTITLKVDIEGIEDLKTNLTSIGELLSGSIKDALGKSSGQDDISKYFDLSDAEKEAENAGENTVEGFNKGIKESLGETDKTGEEFAQSIIDSVENSLEIHSPSKVMERLGKFTADGFLIGFKASFKEVVEAINSDIIGMIHDGQDGISEWKNAINKKVKDRGLQRTLYGVINNSRDALWGDLWGYLNGRGSNVKSKPLELDLDIEPNLDASNKGINKELEQLKEMSVNLDNILDYYQRMDKLIVQMSGSFDELVERGFEWSSITGEHSKFFGEDLQHSSHIATYDKEGLIGRVDSALHTHPNDYIKISASTPEDPAGDLKAFYWKWVDGIKTEFIRGLKETLQFDADQFYSDLVSVAKSKDVSVHNFLQEVNEAISANQLYFANKEKLSLEQIEISKDAFVKYLNFILENSEELGFVLNNDDNSADIINKIKATINGVDSPEESLKEWLKYSLKSVKTELENTLGSKDAIAAMVKRFTIGIKGYILKYGSSTDYSKMVGQGFAKSEEQAFNYVLDTLFKNGKKYSDYVKRFDNKTFDTEIWPKFTPKGSSLIEEDSGQLAFFDKLIEKAKESQEEIEKTIGLIEEASGQLAFDIDPNRQIEGQLSLFDNFIEDENKLQEEVKETNEQIEGQLSLFDAPSADTSIINKKDAIEKLREELNLSQKEANEFINTNFEKVGNKFNIPIEKLDELIEKQKEANANSTDFTLVDTSGTDFTLVDSAEKTSTEVKKEVKAIEEVAPAGEKGAKAKKKMAKANKELAETALVTTSKIGGEIQSMTELSTIDVSEGSDAWEKVRKAAEEYGLNLKDIVSIQRVLNTATGEYSYTLKDINGTTFKMDDGFNITSVSEIKNAKKAWDDYAAGLKAAYQAQSKINQGKGGAKVALELQNANDKIADAEERINAFRRVGIELQDETIKNEELKLSLEKQLAEEIDAINSKQIDKNNETIRKMSDSLLQRIDSEEYTNNNGYKDALRNLLNEVERVDVKDIDKINQLNDSLKDLLSGDISKDAKSGLQNRISGLRKRAVDSLTKNTKMTDSLRAEFESIVNQSDKMLSGEMNYTRKSIRDLSNQLDELDSKMKQTGQSGASMWTRIGNRLSDMNSKLIAQYLSWQDLIRYIRTAINTIRELDTALVDLRKTTTMSTDELREFYYSANETAQQMGVTTAEIINQAAAWSRLGYSSKEAATEMSALSSQFAQISPGMSVETATDGLVSSMKAFGFEVEDVERNIMDNINRIGNTMATNNEEIVQMLERSSAAMAAANNTIEETIALESAAVQVTRNAETTGTAFRTISMRIRGYDEETEEQLEDYEELKGKIADLTKTAKTPGGISLFSDKDKTTFKSTYQLLKDISEIWDELTDKEQAQLTEKLAGKRGGQVLSSIMNDFSEVERAMTEMSNAAGSSDQEMEIIKDSIDYKLNALKESWVGFLQDALSREDTKELFDALIDGSKSLQESLTAITPILTKFVEALSWLIETVAKLNSSTGGLAGLAGLLYGGYKVKSKVNDVRGVMGGLIGSESKNEKSILSGLSLDKIKGFLSKDVTDVFGKTAKAAEEVGTSVVTTATEVDEMFDIMSEAQGVATYSEAMGTATAAETAVGGAATGATLSIGALLGIMAAVGAVIGVLYKLSTAQGEINKQAKEAYDIYNKETSSLKDYQTKIQELRAITDDSTKSIEEQQAAREELLSIQSEMVDQFGIEAGKVDILKDSVDSLNSSFDNLNENAYQEFLNNVNKNEGLQGFWNKWSNFNLGYDTNMDSIIGQMENVHKHFDILTNTDLKDFKKAFEKYGLEVSESLNESTGLFDLEVNDSNLEHYYEVLKKVQNDLKDDDRFSSALTNEANRVKEILDEIGASYNTYLQQKVIFPKYGDKVTELQTIMSQLHQAQLDNNDEEIENLSKKLTEAYESIYQNGEIDESSKQWFANLIKEYQGIIDRQEFVMKIKPEIATDESKEYQRRMEQLRNTGLSQDEIMQKIDIASEHSDKGLSDMGWDEDLIELIRYLQRVADENAISLDFVFNEEKISELPKEIMDILGDSYDNLTEEEIGYLLSLKEEELKALDSTDKLTQALQRFHAEQNKKWSKSEMIDNLTNMADGFDKIDEIYADIYDKGSFDFAKLNTKKFEESFGKLGLDYESFIETVSGHTDDIKYCQAAFDDLVDTFIKQNHILDNVTEATADVTKSMLEMYGVTNADILVTQALEKAEAEEWYAKKNITNITPEVINQLSKEAEEAGISQRAIYDLMIAEVELNNTKLDLSDQIQQLRDIGVAAGLAAADLESVFGGGKLGGDPYAHNYGSKNEGYFNNKKTQLQNLLDEKLGAKYDKAKTKASYGGGKSTKDAIDKANKSAEESKEIIDWIEKALQRQEEEIARIDKVVNATYKNWSNRNSSLLSEINEINKEIGMQTQAYQAYLRDAEAVPLAEEYKRLVREGAMHAETITDKTLKKNIDQYTELYDKAIKAKDAIADLEAKIAQLAKAKFDNVKSEFEGFTSEIDHFVSMIDKELSHVENMNKIAGKSFYNAKMGQDEQKLNDLYKERSALVDAMNEAVANGIEEGSADWIAMRNDIYSVDEAIADLTYEVEDLKKKLKEVAKLNFDDLKSQFENALSIITGQVDLTDAVVSMTQNAGYIASRSYYETLIEGSKENVTGLRKEYEKLSSTLADAMKAGDIEKYSEEWYQMSGDINNVKKELVDAANATIEYANALRQIDWDVFDRGLDRISKLVDESEFLQELMSWDDKLKDLDTGEWTAKGIAKQGLMVQDYQSYMGQANAYGGEAEEIRKLLETDPKNTVLIDRYHELLEAQRQAILNALKEKKALTDLIKEGYDELLKRIKKLIDEYKEALDSAKDLMDYSNSINEKTKNIADISKQLTAYQGMSDTEEGRATIQKLQSQLKDAQKDLEQTEYDKYVSDQKDLLDDFYTELEEYLEGKYQETDVLFEEAVAATNENGKLIDDTLHQEASAVNYRMTDEFTNIWDKYADEGGIAASTLNILDLTNAVTNDIRTKMEDLPTAARLEEFFNSDDLRLLQELTGVKNNTENMIGAINETTSAINQISSNIVEYSGLIMNKLDGVADAVNNLDLSVDVNVDASTGSYDVSGGGDGGGGNPKSSSESPTTATRGTPYEPPYNTYAYQVITPNGDVYASHLSKADATAKANELNNSELKRYAEEYARKKGSWTAYEQYMKTHKFKVMQSSYKKGGLIGDNENFLDSIARLLGEDHMIAAREGERILTEEQNKNFEKMVNANFTPLEGALKDKYSMLSGTNGDIASIMANMPTPQVGNNANIGNTTTIGDINITLPNVTNKEEFVSWLKSDATIERIIQSMTVGRMMGGNSYAKMKY